MKLKRLSIQRQPDDTFAIVAKVEYTNGSMATVILKNKPTHKELQKDFVRLLTDEEELQVEIQYQLTQVS